MSWLVALLRLHPADIQPAWKCWQDLLGITILVETAMLLFLRHYSMSRWCCSPWPRKSMTLQALKLIKHVSNKGAHDYRRAIVKQAKEIRWG